MTGLWKKGWVDSLDWSPVKDTCTRIHTNDSTQTHTGIIIHTPTHTLMPSLVNPLESMSGAQKLILPIWRALDPQDEELVICFCILLHMQKQSCAATTKLKTRWWVSLSSPGTVIDHSQQSSARSIPVRHRGTAVVTVMGSDWAWRDRGWQRCCWAEHGVWLWSMG